MEGNKVEGIGEIVWGKIENNSWDKENYFFKWLVFKGLFLGRVLDSGYQAIDAAL